jgi:hypothetical protein
VKVAFYPRRQENLSNDCLKAVRVHYQDAIRALRELFFLKQSAASQLGAHHCPRIFSAQQVRPLSTQEVVKVR